MNVTVKVSGFDTIINRIEDKLNTKDLSEKLTSKIAEKGEELASDNFANAIYTGQNDVVVNTQKIDKGYSVIASGYEVLFIEYGTGITTREHPTLKYRHGSMSHQATALKQGWWTYPLNFGAGQGGASVRNSDLTRWVTYGYDANNCMYNAEKDLSNLVPDIIKEVLKND